MVEWVQGEDEFEVAISEDNEIFSEFCKESFYDTFLW